MLSIIRCSCSHPDFINLVAELDAYLHAMYVGIQDILDAHNSMSGMAPGIIAYHDGAPAGCGCLRPYDEKAVEIKRMYVRPEMRRRGISTRILKELEKWAAELGYSRALIETGRLQTAAISLYARRGYRRIPNFGLLPDSEDSVCFARDLACTE